METRQVFGAEEGVSAYVSASGYMDTLFNPVDQTPSSRSLEDVMESTPASFKITCGSRPKRLQGDQQNVVFIGNSTTNSNIVKLKAVEKARRKADEVRDEYKKTHEESKLAVGEDKERRRVRLNKLAAAASRVRRDVYIELLEQYLAQYEAEKLALSRSHQQLLNENGVLKTQIDLMMHMKSEDIRQDLRSNGHSKYAAVS